MLNLTDILKNTTEMFIITYFITNCDEVMCAAIIKIRFYEKYIT